MDREKILIVDDDRNICELLRLYLEKEGYETYLAHDGESAIAMHDEMEVDLVLLDVMMPRVDGWEACRRIRAKKETPIIMLTAKGETFDKVLGLELGADDYIVKPFDTKEVVARIKAVLRRTGRTTAAKTESDEGELVFENLVVNITKYELKVNDEVVDTPPKEMELLYYLAKNANKVFTRDALLDEVWGFEYYGDSRTIDVHIKRLREKLEGVSEKWSLKTVWGVGYKFEVKE
ncbi:MAG: response regulator transcription factor [Ruminococcaceae bacterium]|nr:response regulator transcription factor [Oscillospiraceae bacterium]